MQTYLVGGAVRDRLLGRPVRERDWVVVGARPAELEALGFRRVGREFPVFLHPQTGEEYALARTETKTGPGYRGFVVHADPGVSLEEDLKRRDLTINAMAEDPDGALIDPHGGQRDLAAKLLRHVSDAFREDPVRILRAARFAARFHAAGFRIAPETRELMAAMVRAGEADALVAERVWQETESALAEPNPERFFEELRACGALAVVFPELEALFGVPQPEQWHPEVDTGIHTLMVLAQAVRLSTRTEVRFAALVHDLGKGQTPRDEWPRHRGHERHSVDLVRAMCARLAIPNRYRDLAVPVARYHGLVHRARELRPDTLLSVLEHTDAFRRPERFEDFLLACEADSRGRLGLEDRPYPQAGILRAALAAAAAVDAAQLRAQGLSDRALGDALRTKRRDAIAALRAGQAADDP